MSNITLLQKNSDSLRTKARFNQSKEDYSMGKTRNKINRRDVRLDKVQYAIKRFIERNEDTTLGWVVIITGIMLILITIVTISLSATYVALVSNLTPSPFHKNIADLVLRFLLPLDLSTTTEVYISSLSFILNSLFVIITLFFSIVPLLSIYKYRHDINKKQNIRTHIIHQVGVDDLNLLKKYYQGAEDVIVYSGDFSWLAADTMMINIIKRLASESKLHLVSYKEMDKVRKGVNNEELFTTILNCLTFDSKKKFKCSFIRRRGTSVFLYRYDTIINGTYLGQVYELVDTNITRYLLDILDNLMYPT